MFLPPFQFYKLYTNIKIKIMFFLQECNNTRHWYTTYSVPSLEWCYPRNSWWQSNGIRSITTVEIFKWNNWSKFMIASIFLSYYCIKVSWLFIKIYFVALNLILQPIVEVFSLLAIATSYIGFVLGLTDFLADCMYYIFQFLSYLLIKANAEIWSSYLIKC